MMMSAETQMGDAEGGGPGAEDESFGVTDAADVVLT